MVIQIVKKLSDKSYLKSIQCLSIDSKVSDAACRLYSIYALDENLAKSELHDCAIKTTGWSKSKYNLVKSELVKLGVIGECKRYLYLGAIGIEINTIIPKEK